MAVRPQSDCKKILAEFKFGGGVSGPFIKEHCHLLLEVLEQSHEFENLQNQQHASTELATCTAHIEGHRVGPRVQVDALCQYALHTK